mmetsp:Transcript_9033/g.17633  ORF Transcript_9033/g.17633 Transcript_9033/m.17633 type:complete len:247 (+) Transcript_9033:213-953(+)
MPTTRPPTKRCTHLAHADATLRCLVADTVSHSINHSLHIFLQAEEFPGFHFFIIRQACQSFANGFMECSRNIWNVSIKDSFHAPLKLKYMPFFRIFSSAAKEFGQPSGFLHEARSDGAWLLNPRHYLSPFVLHILHCLLDVFYDGLSVNSLAYIPCVAVIPAICVTPSISDHFSSGAFEHPIHLGCVLVDESFPYLVGDEKMFSTGELDICCEGFSISGLVDPASDVKLAKTTEVANNQGTRLLGI